MTVHIIKICVGATSIADLEAWQAAQLAERQRQREPAQLVHVTRMFPKRRDAVLDGGSLYWVIEGIVQVRQPILDLIEVAGQDGLTRCGIVYAPQLVPVHPVPRRPFQGWRYLETKDAPADLDPRTSDIAQMPAQLRSTLSELGLL